MSNEILIVDDEDRIRRLLKMYLERDLLKSMKQVMAKRLMNLQWRIIMLAYY
ncbi:transcriptional regulator srrA [Staphylococcus aureus]|nr:transcriptional regulator srrA [Staphylococcus aureus]